MWGSGTFVPDRVVKSIRDVQHIIFDYVVCSNRLTTQEPHMLVRSIRPVEGPNTVIVMSQNGVGVKQPLRQAFTANSVLTALCYVNCHQGHQVSPGVVRQLSTLDSLGFKIDSYDFEVRIQDHGQSEVDTIISPDPKFGLIENLETERWAKAVINGSWNPVTAILGLETHQLIASSDLGIALVKRLSEEISDVGITCGVPLPLDLRSKAMASMRQTHSLTTSMLRDARKHRQMDIETLCGTSSLDQPHDLTNILAGNIWRQGESVGASAPTMKAVYRILVRMNERFQPRESSAIELDLKAIIQPSLPLSLQAPGCLQPSRSLAIK